MKKYYRWSLVDILIISTFLLSFCFRFQSVVNVYLRLIPAICLFIYYLKNHGARINKSIWKTVLPYLLFLLFSLFSYCWAVRSSYVLSQGLNLIRTYFILFVLMLFINSVEDIEKYLWFFFLSGVLLFVLLVIKTPPSAWMEALSGNFSASTSEGRIGPSVGYQANELGHIFQFFVMLAVYYYRTSHKKKYLLLVIVFTAVVFFTKSRTSLLMLLLNIALYLILEERRTIKKIVMIITSVILVIAAYWAVFNIPVLYGLVGFRFAGLFGTAAVQDASTSTRMQFLMYALTLFKSHPIFGVGLDNFKYYAYYHGGAWAEVYSHSNWGELLADLGMIGTMLYYCPQFAGTHRIMRYINRVDKEYRKMLALLCSYMIINIVFDIQKISYSRTEVLLPTLLAIVSIDLFVKESRRETLQ